MNTCSKKPLGILFILSPAQQIEILHVVAQASRTAIQQSGDDTACLCGVTTVYEEIATQMNARRSLGPIVDRIWSPVECAWKKNQP